MNLEAINALLNTRIGRVLDIVEAAIPSERQFLAARRRILEEMGRDGFLKDLRSLGRTAGTEWNGTGRTICGKKGGEP